MSKADNQNSHKPIKVIRQNVNAFEVGQAYLKAELNKVFPSEESRSGIEEGIDRLQGKDLWRLLEALSFTYRLNGMFWTISNDGFTWSEEEWLAKDIQFLRMHPKIDKVSFSQEIQGDPIKFRDYLQDYFKNHSDDDPEGLGQFRPTPRNIVYPKLFLREDEGQIKLIDGGNRLMAMLQNGQTSFTAFMGREVKVGKPRFGDSTFWLLHQAYRHANENDREAILKTVSLLMEMSSDGKDAVQEYWVDHVQDQDLKKIGEQLLRVVKSE